MLASSPHSVKITEILYEYLTRLYEKSPRRIPAAQTAGPMYEVLIYDNNQTQSGV